MNDVADWPFIRQKCEVIHNGIAPFDLIPREQARLELGIKGDTFTVGTISELRRIKGPDILLRAWKEFKQENDGALVVIGEGEERDRLFALTRALGIQDSVYFLGYMDNAKKYLKAFDVFVLASRSEALPYAPLEAGWASLPVVATEVGGVPEIIKDLETGALVQPEYPEEICYVLQNFSKEPELMKTLGANLRHFVEEEYSLGQMFDKTFAFYEKS
jgi:glycosyltransferase involved in cell wall biosynthesis